MKRSLTLLFLLPFFAHAQLIYPNGPITDSTVFAFAPTDSLVHHVTSVVTVTIDTSMATLWQIGKTVKPVFSGGTVYNTGIMTDTSHPYPRNANDYFEVGMNEQLPNFIIDVYHKYQTDSLHAGGIIEFSTDTGATWMNVANCSQIIQLGVYSATDTLRSGEAAFMGNSGGERLSRLQVVNCWAFKTTTTNCIRQDNTMTSFYLRFRFVSDSTTDTLSGWMIDSIKMENPGCIPGLVPTINNNEKLAVYPNPALNTLTVSFAGAINSIAISNIWGQAMYNQVCQTSPRQQDVDITALPPGIYFIKVNGTQVRKFVKQ